ncbi:MAG: hypothetical protein ACREL6_00410 [Gemmatimonadales bacterium]
MMPGTLLTRRILIVSALVLSASPAVLRAQADAGRVLQRWDLLHLRGGWCLSFMMDPEKAANELPDELVPVPVAEVADVHPAISRTATAEAQYSSWIPSRVCLYHFDTVAVDDRYVFTGDELEEMNDTQTIGIWGIAARGAGTVDSGVVFFIPDFRVRDGSLRAVARRGNLKVDGMDVELGLLPDSIDYRYQYRVAETTLTWDGHLSAPDTSRAVEPLEHNWLVRSTRGSLITATLGIEPLSRHYMAGILSIQGDEELAEALNASPVRMVGPMYLGGSGSIDFER